MKVLITGGCGYVGSVLVPYLAQRGAQITVLDRMWYGNHLPELGGVDVLRGDARYYQTSDKYDVIIHLAAVSNDPSVDDFPKLTWETNVLSTLNLLQNIKCRRFILASSGSVYGVSDAPKVVETTKLNPMSDYNRSKMVAERVALSFTDDVDVIVLRPGTVCGRSPRMRLDLAANAIAKSAALGKITINGGAQRRPVLPMIDMVRAYEYALTNLCDGVYNVGQDNASIEDLVDRMIAFAPNAEVVVSGNADPRSYNLCSDKIKDCGFQFTGVVEQEMLEVFGSVLSGDVLDTEQCYNAKWMRKICPK